MTRAHDRPEALGRCRAVRKGRVARSRALQELGQPGWVSVTVAVCFLAGDETKPVCKAERPLEHGNKIVL